MTISYEDQYYQMQRGDVTSFYEYKTPHRPIPILSLLDKIKLLVIDKKKKSERKRI